MNDNLEESAEKIRRYIQTNDDRVLKAREWLKEYRAKTNIKLLFTDRGIRDETKSQYINFNPFIKQGQVYLTNISLKILEAELFFIIRTFAN